MKNKEEFITEEKVINTPAGGVLIGKDKDGQTIIPNDGSLGGFLIGRLHKDGGIKAINKGTGQPLEMQSNEVVITAPAVADTTKREFEGKMMTNREILSKINSDGGGVSFADGGDIPAKIHTTDCEYKFGGKLVKDTEIAHSLGMNSTLKKGKQHFSSGDTTYDVDAIYNAIKKGKLRLKTKEVETFPMKYPVYDKHYAENHKIDFRKPNGIIVRTESGEEVLIDGNHRMNNAYLKGKKTMKTYYIEDPKQISKFSKKNKFELGGENKEFNELVELKFSEGYGKIKHFELNSSGGKWTYINNPKVTRSQRDKMPIYTVELANDLKDKATEIKKNYEISQPKEISILQFAKNFAKDNNGKIYHKSKSGSVYVRVKDKEIRISDHNILDRDSMNPKNRYDLEIIQTYFDEKTPSNLDYWIDEFKNGGHLSKGKSLKQIAEMHNVSLAHINEELSKGLEVEKEHFADFKERTRVAKDHLVENPNYYTILEKSGLKRGGHIQKQELVEDAKKGDTPARDLDDYNDVLDIQADGMVGGNNGLAFDDGGITPIDANSEGDSLSIFEDGFANGGGIELPKVSYVRVSNSGSSLSNLIGNKYNSYIEFAESVEYAYKNLGRKVRSYVQLQAFDENGIALIDVTTYISDQKNTIKNFNPLTGNYKNLEKSLANSRPISFKKFNWQDWLLSKVTPSVQTTTSTNKSASTSTQSQYPEYYEFIGNESMSFSKGKIYKIINPKDINEERNFIDNLGTANGFSYKNKEKFKPSTEEAFLAQQSGGSSNSAQTLSSSSNQSSLEPKIVDAVNVEFVYPNGRIEVSTTINISNLKNALTNFWNIVDKKSWEVRITPFENQFTPFTQSKLIIGNDFAEFNPETFSEEQLGNKLKLLYPALDWSYFLKEKTTTTKAVKPFDLTDTKIRVSDSLTSKMIQEKAFEQGFEWVDGTKYAKETTRPYLIFKKIKKITYRDEEEDFLRAVEKEIFYDDLFPNKTVAQTSASIPVVPKTVENTIYNLDLAVHKLEKASSTVVTEYNKEIYDKSLKFLYDTKATYELALKFTPESAFMYERLDILKKLADIEKKIKNIEDMKKGGAFYMLAKILEKLERGENWRQSESAEDVITNHIPKSEIEIIIRSQKFKNWFGDWEKALINDEYDNVSKALTDGIPSVYHHGARRIKYTYREVSNGVLYLAENISYALWFSQNATAQSEEGNYLTECFVNIKNPIDLTAFHVNKVDLADIVRYIDAVYPLAKIYDFIPAQVALLIKTNQPTNVKMWAWQLIRSYAKFVNHIKENTPYDGFLYYENNPSDEVTNPVTGQLEENVTKAVAIFKSHQVKVVDAVLFDGGLDDWRFENGGKIKN